MELKDRVAIVTGSGRGIGRAIALEFASQGAKVVCVARTAPQIQQTLTLVKDRGAAGLAIPCDVTDKTAVQNMVDRVVDQFGRIDVLFNNAGSFNAIGPLWEIPAETWWRDVEINLLGPMLCSQAALQIMLRQDEGIIINMNGGGSTYPLPGGSGYGCSKAALLRLTDTLAAELARVGSKVLVFALSPGFVKTEMTLLQTGPAGQQWIPGTKEALEKGKNRPPEDCARAAVKLIKIAHPDLSGRVLGVGTDFVDVARRARQIRQEDLLVMRFTS